MELTVCALTGFAIGYTAAFYLHPSYLRRECKRLRVEVEYFRSHRNFWRQKALEQMDAQPVDDKIGWLMDEYAKRIEGEVE